MESGEGDIDNSGLTVLGGLSNLSGLLRDDGPEGIEVNNRSVDSVLLEVELSDSLLSNETRMVLGDEGSVVVLGTGKTSTTWVLSVLSDSTVSVRNVSSQLSSLLLVSSHIYK